MIHDYITKLEFKHTVAPKIYRLRFKLIEPKKIDYIPGQYLLLKVGTVVRQFSILDYSKEECTFDLLIEYIKGGVASEYIAKIDVGENAEFKGPAGIFIQKDVVRPVIYFATGTGIAPIMPMIERAMKSNNPQPILLYWGLSKKEDVYFDDELGSLSRHYPQFKYVICLSKEDDKRALPYASGRIQKNIETILPVDIEIADCDVYICGGKEMVEDVKEFVLKSGIPKNQLHFERFN